MNSSLIVDGNTNNGTAAQREECIYSNFQSNGNNIHININDYEGTYNVRDVLHCSTDKGEVNYAEIEKYDNNIIVDKVIDGSDIFING